MARRSPLDRIAAATAGAWIVPLLLLTASCAPRGSVRVEVTDLLRSADWEVVAQREDAPVRVGALRPSAGGALGGLDRLALVLPPPAEVELTLPTLDVEGRGALSLTPLCGVDRAEPPGAAPTTVAFELLVDGVVVASTPWTLAGEGPGAENLWLPVGAEDSPALEPGARIGLRTRLVEGDPERPVQAGFAQLVVEREQAFVREPATPERPNLVLIVVDTLRRDRVSAYGYDRPTTPHLDALAERGTLFEQASATSSWTWPSTASILTGLLPEEHGVRSRRSWYLDGRFETLPEALLRGGYSTAAWSGNPLIDAGANFDQGFERFAPERPLFLRSDAFVDEVEAWIEAQDRWKFFLYLQLVDPHDPYVPRAEDRAAFVGDAPDDLPQRFEYAYSEALFRRAGRPAGEPDPLPAGHVRHLRDLYDASVASADHYVGRVLAALERQGLADNTVVAVTSDHGEELLDHGFLLHGHSLQPELVDVPLILAGPGIPRGLRVARPVSNRRLPATLTRLAGLAWGGPTDAPDLFQEAPGPLFFSTEMARGRRPEPVLHGLRDGDLVLHAWRQRPEAAPGALALYDTAADPEHAIDRALLDPVRTEALRARLDARLLAALRRLRGAELETASGHLESLRALGYLSEDRGLSED